MPRQNLTIFQKLSKILGPEGFKEPETRAKATRYNLGNDVILKTTDKAEFETAKLQAQQNRYLGQTWKKAEQSLNQQSLAYESIRMASYADFEAMEYYPEIAAAMDILSEECLAGSTIIPLLNGKKCTIKELYDNKSEDFWVYAVDTKTDKIRPAKVEKAISKGIKKIYKIILDDESEIFCTDNHKWLKSDNSWVTTKDLICGISLKSISTRINYNGYEKISLTNFHGQSKMTHTIVAEDQLINKKKEMLKDPKSETQRIIVHHCSFDKLNNQPNELEYMFWDEHQALHASLNADRWKNPDFSQKMKKIFSETAKKTWNNSDQKERVEKMQNGLKKKLKGLSEPDRIKFFGRPGEQNGMFGTHRIGHLNPNYDKTKNHIDDINEEEYMKFVASISGDRRKKAAGKFNLNLSTVIDYNKTLVKKYKLSRIEDVDFLFNEGYDISKLKDSISSKVTAKAYCKKYNIPIFKLTAFLTKKGYKDWSDVASTIGNHRVVSVEFFGEEMVYDLVNSSVDSNFAIKCNSGMIISHNCTTLNAEGRMVNIYSDSNRVKGIVEDLIFNRLDIHTSLPMWTRNVCKFGDNFVLLNIDAENGITGCKQMPNYEVERKEGDLLQTLSQVDNKGDKVKFILRGYNAEFNSWQVAHFRLLTDDRRLPYGTCLKGDTYVETKTGFKEIKDISIGDEVSSFDISTQEKIFSSVLDKVNSGEKPCYKLSTRHNYVDASKEHKILYYDKESDSFQYKNTLEFKIGDYLVINKDIKTSKDVYINKEKPADNKNGYWNKIDLIPDVVDVDFAKLLGFLVGDGWVHNNATYIALSEHKSINERYINYLEKITGKQVRFTNSEDSKLESSQGICNSKMLTIILKRMGFVGYAHTKRIPEWVYSTSKDIRQAFLDGLIDADGSLFIDKWNCLRYTIELVNEALIKDIKVLVQSLGFKSGKICSRIRTDGSINGRLFKKQRECFYLYFFESENKQITKHDLISRKTDNFILEPIISIEEIGIFETFDIYVENENHNFYANGIVVHNSIFEKARRIWKLLLMAEDAMLVYRVTRAPERRIYKINVGNIDDKDVEAYVQDIASRFKRTQIVDPQTGQIDLKFSVLGNQEDYFIPVRSDDAPSPIDTLPGAANLSDIEDIVFLQRKLFAALRVPKAFLGFEEATGDGKNLALQDIRFSRTINRIQQTMLQELNKIVIIHLFLMGFEDDLDNFTLTLNNPSTQAEMLRIEHLQLKMTLYKDSVSDAGNGFGAMSMTRAKREILGWSDNDIKQDLLEQRMEKAAAAELINSANVIKHTGMFDVVDRIYGDMEKALKGGGAPPAEGEEGGAGGGGGLGGGFGGGGTTEDDLDFGAEEDSEETPEGGAQPAAGEEAGAEGQEETPEASPAEEAPQTSEGIKKIQKLLTEEKKKVETKLQQRGKKYENKFFDRLVGTINREDLIPESIKIQNKNVIINESINTMINDIDNMLDE